MSYQSLFPYFGGKGMIADEVWKYLGRPRTYCEPFCGSARMLFTRPESSFPTSAPVEILNDLNGFVINAYRAIKHSHTEVMKYAHGVHSETDLHARHAWLVTETSDLVPRLEGDPEYYDAKAAGYWIYGQCIWMGSGFCIRSGPWDRIWQDGHQVLANTGDGVISRSMPTIRRAGIVAMDEMQALLTLERYARRLANVRVICGDWQRVVTTASLIVTPSAVFLDPPYDPDGRKSDATVYQSDAAGNTSTARDAAQWAFENGDNPDYRIALCGYEGDYDVPDTWHVIEWTANRGFSTGDSPRDKERVWLSPNCNVNKQMRLFE